MTRIHSILCIFSFEEMLFDKGAYFCFAIVFLVMLSVVCNLCTEYFSVSSCCYPHHIRLFVSEIVIYFKRTYLFSSLLWGKRKEAHDWKLKRQIVCSQKSTNLFISIVETREVSSRFHTKQLGEEHYEYDDPLRCLALDELSMNMATPER